jgi:hypothetical protein
MTIKKISYAFLWAGLFDASAVACQSDFSGFYAGVTVGYASGSMNIARTEQVVEEEAGEVDR